MQHVEFFHTEHFLTRYKRTKAAGSLVPFIDFFWETDFDSLWDRYPDGFSDVLFPNTGYTYLINLGTPFVMQVGDHKFDMKADGFLPRSQAIECYHQPGNKLFGIKFHISPVIFEKKINFSEYQSFIFPLSYLVDAGILDKIKKCNSFDERVALLTTYFTQIIEQYSGSRRPIEIVSEILLHCSRNNDYLTSVETFAEKYKVSSRTLQRYFEMATGLSTKNALQIMRIRKATEHLTNDASSFHSKQYGYYDHSHFYKHLRKFLNKGTLKKLQPHLALLNKLHESRQA
jgi:AraC-like DNA-binding protein